VSDAPHLGPPRAGLIGMRIAMEFGSPAEFSSSLRRAVARGGQRGATLVALLDRGELQIRIPGDDGPCWNAVPLLHVGRDAAPQPDDWAAANAVLEKLERYR
jgi:hypothetical protein